jgi:hypothetical protein
MGKLSPREQKAYKEELAHADKQERAKADAEYNRAMEEGYEAQPPRRTTPTAFERIKAAGGKVVSSAKSGARTAYDAGARIESSRREAGAGPIISSINSGSGFSNQSPRRNQRQANYPDENPNNNGGERIYMTICDSQGNCKQKTIKGGPKKPKRQQGPTWSAGGLGSFGNDPGFL